MPMRDSRPVTIGATMRFAAYDAFIEAFQRHPVATTNRAALVAGETLPPPVSSVNEGASEVLYALASIGGDGG